MRPLLLAVLAASSLCAQPQAAAEWPQFRGNPQLTGVWESMQIKATAPPGAADYKMPAKDAKFKSWLVSCPDPLTSRKAAFARAVLDLLVPPAGGAPIPPGQHITIPPELILRETG